ncbi:cysteine synthase [Nostoc sp. MBR 210]|nr:cysteine synthase [Nostoc sp. MBR 210]
MNRLAKSSSFESIFKPQWNSHSKWKKAKAADVTEALGNVPIVKLKNISAVCAIAECFLKLESCNPGGSIKEKNAVYLVTRAEAAGLLAPGGTIIESSSGNFGVGLAMVGAVRGYRVIIVVDAKTPPPFRRMLKAYGAELVDVPLHEADESGSMQKARMKKAKELAATIPHAWYPCQHLNPWNTEAHSYYTAREIAAHFSDELDAVVVGVSTAGQIMGIARYLRSRFPKIRIVGVDVEGSVIMGTPAKPYKMTGIGLSFFPPNLELSLLDRAYVVPEDLAYSVCHILARREGLLLGASTGAIVAGGLHLARELGAGARILMINPDRGDRYLETVYDADWLEHHGFTLKQGSHLDDAIASLSPVYFE